MSNKYFFSLKMDSNNIYFQMKNIIIATIIIMMIIIVMKGKNVYLKMKNLRSSFRRSLSCAIFCFVQLR